MVTHAAARPPNAWPSGPRRWPARPQINMKVHGVIENMSWFTADDGKRYEIFGAGGGPGTWPTRSPCRSSARSRSCPNSELAWTSASRSPWADPTSEASAAYAANRPFHPRRPRLQAPLQLGVEAQLRPADSAWLMVRRIPGTASWGTISAALGLPPD